MRSCASVAAFTMTLGRHGSRILLMPKMASHKDFIIIILMALLTCCNCSELQDPSADDPLLKFKIEPPNKIEFSNVIGVKIECQAEGDPPPSISWVHLDGVNVENITGLREVLADGSLKLLPFRSEEFRQDVHLGVVQCQALNIMGKLISPEVHLKAVMAVEYESSVYDVFAMKGNIAVVRCHIPSLLHEYVSVEAFIKDDTLKISTPLQYGGKFTVAPYGALYVYNVAPDDSSNFKCQTSHRLTNEIRISNTAGRLLITEPHGNILPRIIDTMSKLYSNEGESVIIPCVAEGWPIPMIRWSLLKANDAEEIIYDHRHKQIQIGLMISEVRKFNSGIYRCEAYNDVGISRAETNLVVSAPLVVHVQPDPQKMENTADLQLHCRVAGYPVDYVWWTKDGKQIAKDDVIMLNNYTLQLNSASFANKGVYQCFAQNSRQTSQGSAVVKLGDFAPKLDKTFNEITLPPGSSATLECVTAGNPPPSIKWTLDSVPVEVGTNVIIEESTINHGLILSTLTLKTARVHEGGLYGCISENKLGRAIHSAKINVHGQLGARSIPQIKYVAGETAFLNCPVYGYPIAKVVWERNEIQLPDDIHQRVFPNYTLQIKNIQRSSDTGEYTCFATDSQGTTVKAVVDVAVIVFAKILPFSFQDELLREGMRARLQCVVTEGDVPVTISWSKDGQPIESSVDVTIRDVDQFSSILAIKTVTPKHNGNYTCSARNAAGVTTHTAQLAVNAAPKIVPFSFERGQMLEGVLARISCVVYQGDLPLAISWLKDGQDAKGDESVSVRNVDEYTSILTIGQVERKHSGQYTCVVNNSADTVTHSASLVVQVPPKIVAFSFQDEQLVEGMNVRASCIISRGDLPLTISWSKDGNLLSADNLGTKIRMIDEYSSVLSIDGLDDTHNGNYSCLAENYAGSAVFYAPLVVNVPPRWKIVPESHISVIENENVMIHCQADGYPKPAIVWMRRSGFDSYDAPDSSDVISIETPHIRIFPNGTLNIINAKDELQGSYYCSATNGIGKGLTRAVHLKVKRPAKIVTLSGNYTVTKGESISVKCESHGDNPIQSSWFISGVKLPDQKYSRYFVKDTTSNHHAISELRVEKSRKADSTVFVCEASNDLGKDQIEIQLIVQGRPDPPYGVKVVDKANRSVEITWQIPFDGNSPLVRFIVEYSEKGGVSKSQTVSGRSTGLIITGLTPSAVYTFTVAAENEIGRSETVGTATVTLAGETPSAAPLNVQVLAIEPQTLKISWEPPVKGSWNAQIKGYYVGYREATTSAPYVFKMLEVPEGYDQGLSFTLSQLKEFTRYSIIVQSFNEFGKGPASKEIIIMTSEDAPSQAPKNVTCFKATARKIHLSWDDTPSSSFNGILRGYRVFYWPVDAWDGLATLQIYNATSSQCVLPDIVPYTNYSIQVLAYTMAGDGVPSKPIYCETLEAVPSIPASLKVAVSSEESLALAWEPPKHPNGRIVHYTVYVEGNYGNSHMKRKHIVQANGHHYEVRGLKAGEKYKLSISASTREGEGDQSIVITSSPSGPFAPARCLVFDQVVKHPILHSVRLPCPAVGIPPPKRTWFSRGQQMFANEHAKMQLDGALYIDKLQPKDNGNYTCRVSNHHGQDHATYLLSAEGPPDVPLLFVVAANKNSVTLHWRPGSENLHLFLGYTLFFKEEFGSWENIMMQPYQHSHVLTGLTCGTNYQIYLTANNKIGSSKPSETAMATTEGGAPQIPSLEDLVEEGTTHITIKLNHWISNGCPISRFIIEYKKHSSKNWHNMNHDIKDSQELVIRDLEPGTVYNLKVTAYTAGASVANYQFKTLPLNEEPQDEDYLKEYSLLTDQNFKILIILICCLVIVAGCVIVTWMWIKNRRSNETKSHSEVSRRLPHSKLPHRPCSSGSGSDVTRRSLATSRPYSGGDDDIEPYAMVKMSDFEHPSSACSLPSLNASQIPKVGSFGQISYNPTAPPMSENYAIYSKHGMPTNDKTFPGRGRPRYSHPKGPLRIKESQHGKPQGVSETAFTFPPLPAGPEGDYDPPPPDLNWLHMKQ